jgi:hypothetical protein
MMYSLLFLLSMSTSIALIDASHLTSEPIVNSQLQNARWTTNIAQHTSNSFDHDERMGCLGYRVVKVGLAIMVSQIMARCDHERLGDALVPTRRSETSGADLHYQ